MQERYQASLGLEHIALAMTPEGDNASVTDLSRKRREVRIGVGSRDCRSNCSVIAAGEGGKSEAAQDQRTQVESGHNPANEDQNQTYRSWLRPNCLEHGA